MYLDARERGIHPLLMAPVLVLTILLAPLGLLAYLAVRSVRPSRPAGARRPAGYSTVTLLARLRGWSTSRPSATAAW